MTVSEKDLCVALTVSQMRELFTDSVRDVVETSKRPRLLSQTELLRELQVSKWTYKQLAEQGLPILHVGGKLRYDLDDVVAWLKENQP